LDKPVEDAVRALSLSFFAVMYVGVLMGFIGLIASSSDIVSKGRFAVLLLLVGTFVGDTGAYTFGRLFGKHLLAPKLSPKKTWEGAVGGLFSTMLSVFIVRMFLLPSISILQVLLLSVFLSILCQIGDLAESFIKRSMGVKDSGNIIPGHGGLLDRIDALLFGAPVVYVFSLFF
jgi:phosphatidate cytidylyltransferase